MFVRPRNSFRMHCALTQCDEHDQDSDQDHSGIRCRIFNFPGLFFPVHLAGELVALSGQVFDQLTIWTTLTTLTFNRYVDDDDARWHNNKTITVSLALTWRSEIGSERPWSDWRSCFVKLENFIFFWNGMDRIFTIFQVKLIPNWHTEKLKSSISNRSKGSAFRYGLWNDIIILHDVYRLLSKKEFKFSQVGWFYEWRMYIDIGIWASHRILNVRLNWNNIITVLNFVAFFCCWLFLL